jgi:hypothetical protein
MGWSGMTMPTMKRSSYMQYREYTELGVAPLKVWGYGKKGKYVCRVELNSAGLAVYTGTKGLKRIANVTWEQLVERIKKKPKKPT